MYSLEFLEIASKDIDYYSERIFEYTGHSSSVKIFLESIQGACAQIAAFPNSCPLYKPVKNLDFEFRMKPVGNYNVFYITDDEKEIVVIARIILAKREEGP